MEKPATNTLPLDPPPRSWPHPRCCRARYNGWSTAAFRRRNMRRSHNRKPRWYRRTKLPSRTRGRCRPLRPQGVGRRQWPRKRCSSWSRAQLPRSNMLMLHNLGNENWCSWISTMPSRTPCHYCPAQWRQSLSPPGEGESLAAPADGGSKSEDGWKDAARPGSTLSALRKPHVGHRPSGASLGKDAPHSGHCGALASGGSRYGPIRSYQITEEMPAQKRVKSLNR